ncbi:MAG: dihydroxyacetone kinase, partial [Calothrix sp. SM1_7_51]|nr:dihydroxyacetone kinase [Calothrix sp. SM1_7_51]
TILAEKICGAAAQQGYSLEKIADLCRRINLQGRSMGMALTSCTTPAKGTPTFNIGDREMEMGIGIHGEPGKKRMTLKSVDEITEMMTLAILENSSYSRIVREWDETKDEWRDLELVDPPFEKGDRLLAFVNSMGGTPVFELYIVYRKLAEICRLQGMEIVRNLVGPYITSLDMQGCSITLLKLDDEMIRLWDAPVKTLGMRWGY